MKKIVKKIVGYLGYEIIWKRSSNLPQVDPNLLFSLLFYELPSNFFFVQIGANDGKHSDPIYDFVCKHKLSGILIEPQPDVFGALRNNYRNQKNVIFANVAISDHDGTQMMYGIKPSFRDFYNQHISASDDASGICSFYKDHIRKQLLKNVKDFMRGKNPDDFIEEITVETRTFESLVRQYHIENIDLLQIDAEGYDYELIKLFDFDSFLPKIINYESKRIPADDQRACETFLEGKGYKLYTHGINTCAVHRSTGEYGD